MNESTYIPTEGQLIQEREEHEIDAEIAEHAAFVAGWTELDRRLVAHDFLNWQFGMSASVRAMVEGDRRDAEIMRTRSFGDTIENRVADGYE